MVRGTPLGLGAHCSVPPGDELAHAPGRERLDSDATTGLDVPHEQIGVARIRQQVIVDIAQTAIRRCSYCGTHANTLVSPFPSNSHPAANIWLRTARLVV